MKTHPLSQLNTTTFNAGRTAVFSDFDGSFMPFRHNDICTGKILSQINKQDCFNKLFQNYASFLQKAQQDLELIITTGRSKLEYEYFVSKIKKLGLFYQAPSKLITRDGKDCYKIQNGEYFINEKRQQSIEQQANWNRHKIENDLANILHNNFHNICIIQAPINKNESDYETLSLESRLKNLTNKEKMNYASFASDDSLFIEIALSERFDSSKIGYLFKTYLKENNIKAKINICNEDKNTYLPQYDNDGRFKLKPGKLIRISPLIDKESITKLNDVYQELDFNIKNKTDNLVVAIGDGSNDEAMLNPLNYLSIYGYSCKKDYDNVLTNEDTLSLIAQLPFAAIIVGEDKSLENLRNFATELDRRGIKKIYVCKNSEQGFLPQLRKAISDYGNQNEEFKYSMNSQLFQEILTGDYSYDY